MPRSREQQRLRWFIAGWSRTHRAPTVAEVAEAAVEQLADDSAFLRGFMPAAVTCGPQERRRLLRAPMEAAILAEMRSLQTNRDARYELRGDRWVRKAEAPESD